MWLERCILNNFDLLYVQTQTSGDCSSGVDPIDTTGGVGGTTSSGGTTSNGNTNDGSTTVIDNPTPSCTDCLEFNQTLSTFLEGLTPEQLEYWNDLSAYPRIQQTIVDYLEANSSSAQSIIFAINAIQDLNNDECTILPTFLNPTQVSAPYDSDIFGDYPAPSVQQDHDAIQQQFNNLRNTAGNLAAVNYLITTYNMNTFGSNSINFNYTISFENGLSNGAHANAIRTFTNGILTSCNLEIDINLFSSVDFGYITRVIKHELLHILQGITYGQYEVSVAAQEFDAYYLQIFGFKELKAITNASIQYQLAKKMITYMKQLTSSEKLESKKQIDKVKLTFPELCKN